MPVTRRPAHLDVPPSGPSLVTRNLRLERGRTSIRLERVEWAALDAICTSEGIDRHAFATRVDRDPLRHEKRSEEHTSELQSLMRISYAVFCLKKKKKAINKQTTSRPIASKTNTQ